METTCRKVERSCIACREKREQQQLIRFVLAPDKTIVVDYRHRLPGRGAYTCIDRGCIDTAVARNCFDRAFRQKLPAQQGEELVSAVAEAIGQRLLGLLGIARKAGGVASGTSQIQAILDRGEVHLLIAAVDAPAGTVSKALKTAEAHGVKTARFADRESLGRVAGRDGRSLIGITNEQFAESLALEIKRLQQIAGEN